MTTVRMTRDYRKDEHLRQQIVTQSSLRHLSDAIISSDFYSRRKCPRIHRSGGFPSARKVIGAGVVARSSRSAKLSASRSGKDEPGLFVVRTHPLLSP